MKPHHRTLAASALLLALFAIPAVHLAAKNRELAKKLAEIETPFRSNNQETLRQRTLSIREMTVGHLFEQEPSIKNAQTLFRSLVAVDRNLDGFGYAKLQYQLNRMSLGELRALRAGLRGILPVDHRNIENVQEMISNAEIVVSPGDPGIFFDGVIKVARFDSRLSKKLQDWAASNPEAAITWFQSKNATTDFQTGSIAGRKNRALVFKSLLEGIAARDLDLAVELFSREPRRIERSEAGEIVIPLALKQAVEKEDDRLLQKVLETAVGYDPYDLENGNPWFDYTKATGDPVRSAELLRSLENQQDLGGKMSAIISAQNELSYREKITWLNQQIPERKDRLRALDILIQAEISHNDFDRYQESLNEILAQPQGIDQDLEILAAVQQLKSQPRSDKAQQIAGEIAAKISDPDLRARAENIEDYDPFSTGND